MKKILETPERSIYVDGNTIIKTGPIAELDWEAHILEILRRVHGIPHITGFTTSLGGERKTLVTDLMPGAQVKEKKGGILPQLANILSAVYEAGIAHMRVKDENVLVGDGLVSLIGFSKASLLEANPMALFPKSPDMIGTVGDEFKLTGPLKSPEGSYAEFIGMQ